MRNCRFFIVEVRPDISDVWICQADDLPRIAGIGKDFLITGEACIENNLTTAPRDRSCGAALKNSSVFECKNPCSYDNLCQLTLPGRYLFPAAKSRIEPK